MARYVHYNNLKSLRNVTPKNMIVDILKGQIGILDVEQKKYHSPHTNIRSDYMFVFSTEDGSFIGFKQKDLKLKDDEYSVENYMFGNGFDINQSTSDYRLKKVADRILEEARNKFEMMEYLKLLK